METDAKRQESKKQRGESRGARERLLRAAEQLFYHKGYHRTGINRIIEAAGVAKASFYNHFASKEELGLAHVKRRHEAGMADLKARISAKDTPEKRLEAVFDHIEALAEREGFRGCGLLNMAAEFPSGEHPIRVQVRWQKQEVRDYLKQLIRNAAEESSAAESMALKADKKEVQARADAVYLLYEAAMVESENFGDTWPVGAAREAVRRFIGAGIEST